MTHTLLTESRRCIVDPCHPRHRLDGRMDGWAPAIALSASGPLGIPKPVAEFTTIEFGREAIGRAFSSGYPPTSSLRGSCRQVERSAAFGYASFRTPSFTPLPSMRIVDLSSALAPLPCSQILSVPRALRVVQHGRALDSMHCDRLIRGTGDEHQGLSSQAWG